jgi:hypothetical protein
LLLSCHSERSEEPPHFAVAVAVAVAVALALALLVVIPEGDLLLPLHLHCRRPEGAAKDFITSSFERKHQWTQLRY